jgi:hypothetical protein
VNVAITMSSRKELRAYSLACTTYLLPGMPRQIGMDELSR